MGQEKSVIRFEEVLQNAAALPLVRIDRDEFLKTELTPHFSEDVVATAILHNPAYAGISVEEINKIARGCIRFETTRVTSLSTLAGIPGGLAMIGTIPADLIQYLGHLLRILQKLIYLYGWKELFDENGKMDDETANLFTLFCGVMFGVEGATKAVTKVAEKAAANVAKKLAQKHLTKGIIYPIVKKIAGILGFRMTKQIFANGVAKFIPVLGGAASGLLTYASYKPMAYRLKSHLETLKFADADFYAEQKRMIETQDYVVAEATEAE